MSKERLPVVAIVGRPNVGKSTFFNRMIGMRRSLVQNRPGVTRDRIYGEADYLGRRFILIDTGGFEADIKEEEIYGHVREQAFLAIDEADVVLLFCDGRQGVTSSDQEVARLLRERTHKPLLVVVNKIDTERMESHAYEFYQLGVDRIFPLSSETGYGGDGLLDQLLEVLPAPPEEEVGEADKYEARIALIGRPNVGKSSLANKLLGYQRQITHDAPGTTRDSIDIPLEIDGRHYLLVDTAGVRRAARITDKLERFTVIKAFKALSACDTAILILDPNEGVTQQEQRLAGMAEEKGCALIVLVNKWDLFRHHEEITKDTVLENIQRHLPFVPWAPVHFISAKEGYGVSRVMDLVREVRQQHLAELQTAALNSWLDRMTTASPPPVYHGKPIRLMYITQVNTAPPTFLVFVNHPEGMRDDYRRFLVNQLRVEFGLTGTPLRLVFRQRS